LNHIGKSGKPLAIIDESGGSHSIDPRLLTRAVRILHVGTTALPGSIMGETLLRHGHRSVAFFMPLVDDPAYRRRYEGVCDAYRKVGFLRGVTLYTPRRHGTLIEHVHSLQVYKRAVDSLAGLATDGPQRLFLSAARSQLFNYALVDEFSQLLRPLFCDAVQQQGVSAWICGNDDMALIARSFLDSVNPPPKHIPLVIGFDDIPAAFALQLSSYNFNAGRVAELACTFVLDPATPLLPQSFCEIPGFVVMR
jgi:DNA-binding LacI/PurR family transcriptional regulator